MCQYTLMGRRTDRGSSVPNVFLRHRRGTRVMTDSQSRSSAPSEYFEDIGAIRPPRVRIADDHESGDPRDSGRTQIQTRVRRRTIDRLRSGWGHGDFVDQSRNDLSARTRQLVTKLETRTTGRTRTSARKPGKTRAEPTGNPDRNRRRRTVATRFRTRRCRARAGSPRRSPARNSPIPARCGRGRVEA